MKKSKTRIVLIGLIILVLGFVAIKNLFEIPENPHTEFIARQKFSGIIQKKYTDTISEVQQILVDGKKYYVDKEFYNQLNIGDSVSKKLYELNAIIYKTDGRIIQYDLINTKKKQ
ncbi:hypothetical protein [Flavobacterium aquicola]|uniref:Uncharacterized protein n=1 Tax=Flavobacterium aquicola TaxID=1682742 RepID=A0A3E0EMR7_9FLAO|nr:hypothetical protein [Flavobacterium aquicola]REG99003.1 hypothetical protein C8P67_105168 [Flavobacterium aquicola]